MENAEDKDEWLRYAFDHVEVVANELISLRDGSGSVPWRKLIPTPELVVPLKWGIRGPRTRAAGRKKEEEDDDDAVSRRRRSSPKTPMDFSSGASFSGGSGGEEGTSAPFALAAIGPGCGVLAAARRAGVSTKVERAPVALQVAAARPIRRSGRKKTLAELQEEERSLLQEREVLQKEVEAGRRARIALLEDNERLKRLKLTLPSKRVPDAAPNLPVRIVDRKDFVPLPDLNELPESEGFAMEHLNEELILQAGVVVS